MPLLGSERVISPEMGLGDELTELTKALLSVLSVREVGTLGAHSSQRDLKAVMPLLP